MRKLFVVALLAGMYAGSASAGSETHYVIAFAGDKATAVSVVKPAEFVAMALTVESSQKDPTARWNDIKQAQALILARATNQSGLVVHKGPVSLSARPGASKLASTFPYSSVSSSAQLQLLVRLDETTDAFAGAARIRQFLDPLTLPGKAECSLGPIQLALANPEQYRLELLQQIAADVKYVSRAMQTPGQVTLHGLEQPVLVRQVDDQRLELFINYSMSLELPPRSSAAPEN
jgi:hypothetical protein